METQIKEHVARLEDELQQARHFQRGLLPQDTAALEGVALAACHRPCEALSGDFYDYVAAGSGRVTVLVADVSGHGVGAAMLVGGGSVLR